MKKTTAFPGILFSLLFLGLGLVSSPQLLDTTALPRFALLAVFHLLFLAWSWPQLSRAPRLWPPYLLAALGLFFASQVFSLTAAGNSAEAYFSLMRYALHLSYLLIALYYFARPDFDPLHLLRAGLLFALAAALPAAAQLLESLASGSFFEDIYQITGNFSHKNLLSSALMLSLPLVLMLSLYLSARWRWLLLSLALLICVEIFVLRTRGVWLGLILGAGVAGLSYALRRPAVKIPPLWLAIFLLVPVVVLSLLFASPQIKAGFSNSANVEKRLAFWDNSLAMIADHPLRGVGAGQWKFQFPRYGLEAVDHSTMQGITHIQRPHNDFLWVWAEAGPLALLAYLALFALPLWQVFRNIARRENGPEGLSQYFALGGIVSYAVFSFGDFPLERASHSVLYFSLVAWVYRGSGSLRLSPKSLWLFLAVLQLLALGLIRSRWGSEIATQEVLRANQQQNARALVPAVEAAWSPYFQSDVYANPLRYYSGMGLAYQGKTDQALVHLAEARQVAPYNILVFQAFANTHARRGEMEQALAYLDTALQISPRYEMARLLKAEILLDRDQPLLALETLNAFPPESTDQRYQLALARALRACLSTYPQEHQRFPAMMEHLRAQPRLEQPMDYVRAYREKRGVGY